MSKAGSNPFKKMYEDKLKKALKANYYASANIGWEFYLDENFEMTIIDSGSIKSRGTSKTYTNKDIDFRGLTDIVDSLLDGDIDITEMNITKQEFNFKPSSKGKLLVLKGQETLNGKETFASTLSVNVQVPKKTKPKPPKIKWDTKVVGPFLTDKSGINQIEKKSVPGVISPNKFGSLLNKLPKDLRARMREDKQTIGNKAIIIDGYADNRGTEEHNRKLGDARAEAVFKFVKGYLVDDRSKYSIGTGREKNPNGNKAKGNDNPGHRVVIVK